MNVLDFYKNFFKITGTDLCEKNEIKKIISPQFRFETIVFSPFVLAGLVLIMTMKPICPIIIICSISIFIGLMCIHFLQIDLIFYFFNYFLSKRINTHCKKMLYDYCFSINNFEHITYTESNMRFVLERLTNRNLFTMKYRVFEKKKVGCFYLRIYRSKIVFYGIHRIVIRESKYPSFDDFNNALAKTIYESFYPKN